MHAAGSDESKEQAANYSAILDQQLAQTNQWDAFMRSRSWKPGVPVGEQMTPAEANRFGNLQEQTKIGLLTTMLEAKRLRDLRVFLEAASLAERMDLDSYIPQDDKSEEFLVGLILTASREQFPLNQTDAVALLAQTGKCTFENALIAEAQRVYQRVSRASGLVDASTTLNALSAKYGKPIDRSKLSPDEKLAFDRSVLVANQVKAELGLYNDLLFIARLEQVSKLQRDVRRWSQYEAPGNVDHINVVWEVWKGQNKITPSQDALSRIVNYINEKIPTEWANTVDDLKRSASGDPQAK